MDLLRRENFPEDSKLIKENIMTLKIKKLRPGAIIPKRATKNSAGLDVHACIDKPVEIPVGEIRNFPIGIAVAPDCDDVVMLMFPRSGLGRSKGISLPNCVGVIDSDYRGEIQVPLINHGREPYTVLPGEKIAQLVTVPVIFPDVEETDTLSKTDRGEAGFGSSGKF